MLGVLGKNGEVEKWYTVKDPAEVKSRITIKNFRETFLCVAAQKTEEKNVLCNPPLQSDYAEAWRQADDGSVKAQSGLKVLYKKYVPGFIQSAVQGIKYKLFSSQRLQDDFIGIIDPKHIQETKL